MERVSHRVDRCPECDTALIREETRVVHEWTEVNGQEVEKRHEHTWTVTCETGHHWAVETRTNVSPRWFLSGRVEAPASTSTRSATGEAHDG